MSGGHYSSQKTPILINTEGEPAVNDLLRLVRSRFLDPPGVEEGFLSPGKQNVTSQTQLHQAALYGAVDEITAFLAAGAAVDLKDDFGNEPFYYAALSPSPEAADLLIRYGAKVNAKGYMGYSPLHCAVGQKSMVDRLLRHGADPRVRDYKGDSPLHLAILVRSAYSEPSESVIESLVGAGSDVNAANDASITAFEKLLLRSCDSAVAMSRYLPLLLNYSANVASRLRDGRTHLEVFLGHCKGRDWAKEGTGQCSIFKAFLRKGAAADVTIFSGEWAVFEFFKEVASCDMDTAQLLCERVNLGNISNEGDSLLHKLRKSYSLRYLGDLMVTVVQRGANVNQRNNLGRTPLMEFLIANPHSDAAKTGVLLLLGHRANPLVKDVGGNCPLYQAAATRWTLCLRDLLKAIMNQRSYFMHSCYSMMPDERSFWHDFNTAINKDDWADARNFLYARLPGALGREIHNATFKLLVDEHLEQTKGKFEGEEDAVWKWRDYRAGILWDYHLSSLEKTRGLKADSSVNLLGQGEFSIISSTDCHAASSSEKVSCGVG